MNITRSPSSRNISQRPQPSETKTPSALNSELVVMLIKDILTENETLANLADLAQKKAKRKHLDGKK